MGDDGSGRRVTVLGHSQAQGTSIRDTVQSGDRGVPISTILDLSTQGSAECGQNGSTKDG